jgi:hypothetical protein
VRYVSVELTVEQVHHILAEIIQGGLVLETNVEEIDSSGMYIMPRPIYFSLTCEIQYNYLPSYERNHLRPQTRSPWAWE